MVMKLNLDDARQKAAGVRHLVLDVDGVLTDGSIVYTTGGEQILSFHVHDGLGIKLLASAGIGTSIISARGSRALERRAQELGIYALYQGQHNKRDAFMQVCSDTGLSPHELAAVGDDLVDLPMLMIAGFSVAVSNAQPAILPHVHYITDRSGGNGAVREVSEFILQAIGAWDQVTARFFNPVS